MLEVIVSPGKKRLTWCEPAALSTEFTRGGLGKA